MLLDEHQRWTILNALNVAKRDYKGCAIEQGVLGAKRTATQFERQVNEAQELYDLIEQAEAIELRGAETKEPMPLRPYRKWRGVIHNNWATLCATVYTMYPNSTVSLGLNEMIVAQAGLGVRHIFDAVREEHYYEICDQPKHTEPCP